MDMPEEKDEDKVEGIAVAGQGTAFVVAAVVVVAVVF